MDIEICIEAMRDHNTLSIGPDQVAIHSATQANSGYRKAWMCEPISDADTRTIAMPQPQRALWDRTSG